MRKREKGLIINEIKYAREEMSKGFYDIFIFDELLTALNLDMIEEKELIELLKSKPEQIEIILTGLRCNKRIMDMADTI